MILKKYLGGKSKLFSIKNIDKIQFENNIFCEDMNKYTYFQIFI